MTARKTQGYGPYSPIKKAGNLFFVSGQVGIDPDTKQALPDADTQAHQVLKNLQAILKSADLSLENVVKTTMYLTNMDDFKRVNEIYQTYFAEPRPARSCVEVTALPRIGDVELLLEIEAVAMIEGN